MQTTIYYSEEDQYLLELVDQVASISPLIPLHISRYHPMHKYHEPATSIQFLEKAYKIASEKMHYVYLGNVWSDLGSSSFCRDCGAVLVRRSGYHTEVVGLDGGACSSCGRSNYFVHPCRAP